MDIFKKLNIKDYKALGYGLLIAGLVMIIFSVLSMYSVYTGATPAPPVITMNSVTISLPTGPGIPPVQTEIISGIQASKLVNMSIWYALMFFIASAGGRIAGLGTKLVREIKVEVKRED
jgi:hypothetical protein